MLEILTRQLSHLATYWAALLVYESSFIYPSTKWAKSESKSLSSAEYGSPQYAFHLHFHLTKGRKILCPASKCNKPRNLKAKHERKSPESGLNAKKKCACATLKVPKSEISIDDSGLHMNVHTYTSSVSPNIIFKWSRIRAGSTLYHFNCFSYFLTF